MVVLCHTRERAEQIKARLAEWLAPRGLSFNEDKTQIVHLAEEGFDFLGFNVRRYRSKLLIKPSKAAIRRLRQRLAFEMRTCADRTRRRSSPGSTRSSRGGPPITGVWCRPRCSTRWITRCGSSPTNGRHGATTTSRSRGSSTATSASATSSGTTDGCSVTPTSNAYLVKFSWTDIVRHVMVTGAASPDDPALTDYWAKRRRKVKPPLDNYTLRLLARQDARCPLCGDHLLAADQPPQSPHDWERWWLQVTRKAIAADYLVHHGRPGPPDNDQTRLVHASCHRGLRARLRGTPAQSTCPPLRLA